MEDGTHSTLFCLPKPQVNQSLRTLSHSEKSSSTIKRVSVGFEGGCWEWGTAGICPCTCNNPCNKR